MRISRKESNCAKCPLRDRVRVRTEAPDGPARIVLIGEAPGAREEVEGRPFCGPAGGVLNSVLTEAEIARHNCRVMNVINCRPTDNDIESEEAHEAIVCCAAGFQAELKDAVRKGAKVFMPLGATAQRAMGIEGGITKNRGSVFSTPSKVPAIPTFHPSFILRGMQKEEPTWIADFKKAKDISKRGWKAPEEHFNLFPTLGEVEEFIERAIRKKSLIAVDLETTGLSPDRAEIFVIGLASDGETAISVPFFRHGGGPYWENGDELAVKQLLQKLFSANELLFQNAFFDVSHLRHKGFRVERKIHDALLLHHAIHPELPHNLGYIVSIYGQTPYWKDGVLGRDGSLSSIPDEHLRSYNLRDSVVLHQIYPGLLADGKELGVLPVYHDISAPLVPVLSTAFLRGIRVDQRKLGKYKRSLQSHLEESDAALRDIAQLPPAFNLSSDDHLRKLFYGEDAPQFKRALQEAGQYDLDLRKRRDTKKYKELQDRVEVCSKTVPLWCAPRQKYTKGDRLSVAEDALLSIQIAALGRAEYLRGLKKKDTRAELALIEKTLKFLKVYRDFQETDKMLSTFTSFPLWSDGKWHPQFKIHGTATGRLSSGG
jgi:DNA polymerase